jgi:GTP cyclohydrolase I
MDEDRFDDEKIEKGVRMILEGIGEDPDRGGLRETPGRVSRMYREVFAGIGQDASQLVTVVEGADQPTSRTSPTSSSRSPDCRR